MRLRGGYSSVYPDTLLNAPPTLLDGPGTPHMGQVCV